MFNGIKDGEDRAIRDLGGQRLEGWLEILVKEKCTPFILVGVGHGSKSGETTVLTCHGIPDVGIAIVLTGIAEEIFKKEKGVSKMGELPREIEVQRVMNLVTGFGWTKVKEEFVGTKVQLTFEKDMLTEEEITAAAPPT